MAKTFLAFVLSLCIGAAAFTAYGVQALLTFENDALIPHGGDHDYTHGTCIEVVDGLWHYKAG